MTTDFFYEAVDTREWISTGLKSSLFVLVSVMRELCSLCRAQNSGERAR